MHKTPGRTLQIWGDTIDYDVTGKIKAKLEEFITKDPNAWITLEISCGGGKCLPGFALYDWIRMNKIKLQTIALAQVQSMAVILYLAGEHRLTSPNTFFYLHDITLTYKGETKFDADSHARAAEDLVSYRKRYLDIVQGRIEKPPKNLKNILVKSRYLQPDEALTWGIAHELITLD